MLMVAAPPLRVAVAETVVPLVSVTEPVGAVEPLPPLTLMFTVTDCVVVAGEGEGNTVTVGVAAPPAAAVVVASASDLAGSTLPARSRARL